MTEAYRILREYSKRLCQVHVSEVNTASRHDGYRLLPFSLLLKWPT